MKLKAIISLLLCFLMVSAVFVSCTDDPADTSSTESKAGTSQTDNSNGTSIPDSSGEESEDPYTDSNGIYSTKNLPAFKDEWRDYETFRVLVTSDETQKTYFNEEIENLYETTDSAIAEGVTRRNNWVYDIYGITVKAVPVSDCLKAIRDEVSGNLNTFDAAMPFMSAAATLAQEGLFYDLAEFEDIIDLDAPWWDQNATSALSIGNRVYFTTGDMSIMQKIVSSGIAFNKDLLANYFPGYDIYEDVYNGTWTLDKLYSMSKQVTGVLEDDGVMDEKDMWGIIDTGPSFFYGCGEQLVTKDENNYPVLALTKSERSINVAQKVLALGAEKKTWYATVDDWTDRTSIWDMVVKVFGEGRSLFMALHFSAVKKLRPYDVNYGIVPAAKFNETQDNYYTKCSANYANAICIPKTVRDEEFSAYMIELLSIGGKNHISNTYYNVVLKSKDIKDEDSERMLDIIFNNIVYDPAIVYKFDNLNNLFNTLIQNKSTDIVSALQAIEDAVLAAIDDVIANYDQ